MKVNNESPIVGSISVACPDCGDRGPHDVYRYQAEREFVCSCGMQHPLPPVWTFEGYWNTVIGSHTSAADVANDRAFAGETAAEWLAEAEHEAWRAGGLGGDIPEEWAEHRERALAEITAAT